MIKNNRMYIIVAKSEKVKDIDIKYLGRYLADGYSWYTSEEEAIKGWNDGDAYANPMDGKIVGFEISKGFLVKEK